MLGFSLCIQYLFHHHHHHHFLQFVSCVINKVYSTDPYLYSFILYSFFFVPNSSSPFTSILTSYFHLVQGLPDTLVLSIVISKVFLQILHFSIYFTLPNNLVYLVFVIVYRICCLDFLIDNQCFIVEITKNQVVIN